MTEMLDLQYLAYQSEARIFDNEDIPPSKQRQGIGMQLLLKIEKQYPKQRYELFTSTRSEKNIAWYKKLGYKIFNEEQVAL